MSMPSSLMSESAVSTALGLYTDLAGFPAIMQKTTRRIQRQKLGRSAHWKALLIIFLVVSVPTIGTILVVLLSSRPSLSDRTFSNSGDPQDADILDWPKLYSLNDRAP